MVSLGSRTGSASLRAAFPGVTHPCVQSSEFRGSGGAEVLPRPRCLLPCPGGAEPLHRCHPCQESPSQTILLLCAAFRPPKEGKMGNHERRGGRAREGRLCGTQRLLIYPPKWFTATVFHRGTCTSKKVALPELVLGWVWVGIGGFGAMI